MQTSRPVPWELTGNHWISLPCIDPADGSIHAVGVIHRGSRSAVEFAGSAGFEEGGGRPLMRPKFTVAGAPHDISADPLEWETALGWVPTFTSRTGGLVIRGTLFAPYGRDADLAGAVYVFALENTTGSPLEVSVEIQGTLGHRQLRVRTPRAASDDHMVSARRDVVVLEGAAQPSLAALALIGEGDSTVTIDGGDPPGFTVSRRLVVAPGERSQAAFFLAVGPEGDGAEATARALKRRGWRDLLAATRDALQSLEQTTGDEALDRVINRNLLFAYFFAVARAVDDSQHYIVRTRAPGHDRGLTVREWEALSWVVPAVQLADPSLARELIVRACEIHGYAPGQGVRYLDGSTFEPGFSLDGAAAYAIAVERYIRETGDDRIIDEPVVGDTLYVSHDDISARRHEKYPLYATEVAPSGVAAAHAYTLHGNAAAAMAFDVYRRTLDEETARGVADPAAVRAAIRRHMTLGGDGGRRFAMSADLAGSTSDEDDNVGSALWLPVLEAVDRNDSDFRRTVKALPPGESLARNCARLFGPDSAAVLRWIAAAELHRGLAAESVDSTGRATGNPGDAALAGLLAWSIWYSIHAVGSGA